MPRENSFTDSEGRSLTPDLEDEERFEGRDQPAVHEPAPMSPVLSQRSPRLGPRPLPQNSAVLATTTRTDLQNLTPKQKFQSCVRKVMALHRGTTLLTGGGRIGAEPGVDPRRASADLLYGNIHQECVIEIVDYSSVRSSFGRMTNKEFVDFLDDPKASQREPWAKVRWVNIRGISWDVIKAVSIAYDLHPLALEDVFHTHRQNRSKADYYTKHLFLRILCHELSDNDSSESTAMSSTLIGVPRSASPEPMDEDEAKKMSVGEYDEERTMYGGSPPRVATFNRRKRPLLPNNRGDLKTVFGRPNSHQLTSLVKQENSIVNAQHQRAAEEVSLDALKKDDRVKVNVEPMFVFLFRDGLVISIYPSSNHEFTAPITQRLRSRDTVLRTSADASLLVHSLLDLIVDKALVVVDEYHAKINKFEQAILLKPQMKTVRKLHILSGDLILHKRTMDPIKTLVYGLRRYDVDRCAALIDMADPANKDVKVVGFMSHKSKIYLADVFDHMEYILTSLEMFAGVAENLISYTFNLVSYEMNQVMRRLTLATIIFLPLTLLTGYFGMNFSAMWSVDQHTDLLFWEIAIPVMVVIISVFTIEEIKGLIHYIQKRMLTKEAVKTMKRD